MARRPKLKVYCTPIGFHDAYVAAPSQKAALQAWGSDSNLFAQGFAKEVTDGDLIAEPLRQPGKVLKRLRGTSSEQEAALGRHEARRMASREAEPVRPKPSRAALSAAEKKLAESDRRRGEVTRKLEAEIQALQQKGRALEQEQAAERRRLEKQRDDAQRAYDQAMAAWQKA